MPFLVDDSIIAPFLFHSSTRLQAVLMPDTTVIQIETVAPVLEVDRYSQINKQNETNKYFIRAGQYPYVRRNQDILEVSFTYDKEVL